MIIEGLILGTMVGGWIANHVFAKRRAARIQDALEEPQEPQEELEDEDRILAYLETEAVSAPLAARLLQDGRKLKGLLEPPKPPEKWRNNPDVHTPCDEQWRLFLEDARREETEEGRLGVLRFWLGLDNKFTHTERSAIIDLFDTQEGRAQARAAFLSKKSKRTKRA